MLTPQGQKFNQTKAIELSSEKRLVLIAGKYEGFDERIRDGLDAEQISIGDYILNGGELAAMVIIDAVVRLIPGVSETMTPPKTIHSAMDFSSILNIQDPKFFEA